MKSIEAILAEFDALCEKGFADNRYTGKANYQRLRIYLETVLKSHTTTLLQELIQEILQEDDDYHPTRHDAHEAFAAAIDIIQSKLPPQTTHE